MPPRNRRKTYSENSYYHVYNRGNNRDDIFRDDQDYGVFLSYLKEYLMPKDTNLLLAQLSNPIARYQERDRILKALRLNNFSDEISLLAYTLMPNHFHLFLKQKSSNGMNKFILSLCTRYSMYFNRKYKHVGRVFQDIYKAVAIVTEPQFVYLSKYIHKQALQHLASQGPALQSWHSHQSSSYDDYIGRRKTGWVHPEEVLAYFSKANQEKDYQSFVEGQDMGPVENILLEDF